MVVAPILGQQVVEYVVDAHCPKQPIMLVDDRHCDEVVRGEVRFDIYGPTVDAAYWTRCLEAIARAPQNVRITYQGAVPHVQIAGVFAKHHFFVLPTFTENFGHVILESLFARCPVVLSDKTPWRDLARLRAGWDIPLDDVTRWKTVLQGCVDMGGAEHETLRAGALQAAALFADLQNAINAHAAMFDIAVASTT